MSDVTATRRERLRNIWLATENRRTKAWQAFMAAYKNSPLGQALAEAEDREKRAREAYSQALQRQTKGGR